MVENIESQVMAVTTMKSSGSNGVLKDLGIRSGSMQESKRKRIPG
jgi:hypothetical protein